jgi:iron complex outermembrane receptor protein
LPNPNLGPEIADHFEVGYKWRVADFLFLVPAVYYSVMDGKIVNVKIPNPNDTRVHVDYAINLDRTSFYGFELGAELNANDYFSAGLTFSLNEYKLNKIQNKEVFVISYYPEVTTSGYMIYNPVKKLEIVPRLEYVGSRHANTAGTNKLSSYWLANIRVKYDFCDHLSFSAGINNLFDRLYEIREHYPMAGRAYTFSLSFK